MGSAAAPVGSLPRASACPIAYSPRHPKATSLYQLLDTHFETLRRQWEERRMALEEAIEWNYQIVFESGFDAVARNFERLFRDPRTRPLDASWIENYRER